MASATIADVTEKLTENNKQAADALKISVRALEQQQAQKKVNDESRAKLEELKATIESAGGVAEKNSNYNKLLLEQEKAENNLRQKSDNVSAKENAKTAAALKISVTALKQRQAQKKAIDEGQTKLEELKSSIENAGGIAEKNSEYNKLLLEQEKRQNDLIKASDDTTAEVPKKIAEARTEQEAMRKSLEEQGKIATDNKKYNKLAYNTTKEELKQRYKDATSPSAKKEIRAEQKALADKQENLLTKISKGITGILGGITDMGKRALKGAGSLLKKSLFAGMYLALLAFVNSKYWDKFIDIIAKAATYVTEKLIPLVKFLWEKVKKIGKAFSAIADFLGLTNTELALYGLGGMFAFKIISKVLRIGKSLLGVAKFITSGLITPLVNVVKNAPKVLWDAIKNIGTVFKNVRIFLMTNMITPMKDAVKNAFMKSWNLIKTLPTVLATMRTFMMTNILNPLIASATAAKAKLWTFMSKILPALIALKTFFLATLLPTLAAFAAPIGLIVLAVAAVALVLYGLYEAFQDFKETLARTGSIGEAIKVAIGKFVGVLLGAIPALFLKLVAFVADLFGFKEFAKKIGDIDPIQWIADTAVNFMNKIGKFFGSLFDIDFKGLLDEIVPDFVKNSWLGRQLGYTGSDTVTPEQAKQARIEEMEKKKAALGQAVGYGGETAEAAKKEIAKLDKKIADERATGEADVQKAIERGQQADIAQVEDLTEAEIKASKDAQALKTKKQTDHEGKMKNIVKNTAKEVAAASTITDLSAGFGPTSFVATPESPAALKNQEKTSTMQKQAAETAARMGISSPYTNVTSVNPTSISADKTTNHYSFDNKRFNSDSVPTMLTNAL